MKRVNLTMRLLIIAAIVLPSLAGINFGALSETAVRADSKSKQAPRARPGAERKVSKDLIDEIGGNPEKRTSVIIQTGSVPRIDTLSAVTRSNGRVKQVYERIDAFAVELPAKAVAALATRDDVKYI